MFVDGIFVLPVSVFGFLLLVNNPFSLPLRLSTVSPIDLNSAATILCSYWYFVIPDKSNRFNPIAFCK